ncbi:LLM class flavin-dependent oxidoreductase [Ancylobacter sp. 6x-1]|uniref:LLM class flavin-dependent oxidoreductase n=1 Tax=Ancylobacter crimeensis TaxID=2579147 RepID=A0ABT0D8L4_9HYPH|nr:LLM class flavin-dependent oxidoreductase [Ancylobacter crimeensis]MCK0196293.1 LLM class flavin-dependent oxidoreductase [Ancylobacter crimeensis]
MELGLYTFADLGTDPDTGRTMLPSKRMAHLLEEIALADAVGLDVFGIGEHHRADYLASTPAVILAAAAARTKTIRLTSAVTVLSSDDPVRVFQEFTTLDLLSGGRAEIMVGRGSFIESFPLFGHDLDDYDALFTEKLDLLLKLRAAGATGAPVTWHGAHRPALDDIAVHPRPEREIPITIAVGGTPQSVARAGALGLPLAIAIIGGEPRRFAPLVELYREAGRRAGQDPARLKVSINAHGFVGESHQAAADALFPAYAEVMGRLGRERGWPPLSRARFDASTQPAGNLVLGSPDEVAEKILAQHGYFHHDRFMMQSSLGPAPHREVLRSIELFGMRVAPVIRRELGVGRPDVAAVTGGDSAALQEEHGTAS